MLRTALAALSILALAANAAPIHDSSINIISKRTLESGVNITTWKPVAQEASRIPGKSSHIMSLKKRKATSVSKTKKSRNSKLTSIEGGWEFATSVTLGTQTFDLVVDTGSSDTWVVAKDFTCVDVDTGNTTTDSDCGFGTTYSTDSTLSKISKELLNISYGDGESAYGYMAIETVVLADITIDQEIAVVTKAVWAGDNITSGIVGLAYPYLTSAYEGKTSKEYRPIFTTMVKKGLIDSYFSLAIFRDVSGSSGYLTLGGIPPVNFTEDWTSTDIIITSVEDTKSYSFYTINVDSISVNGKSIPNSGGSNISYIVDSGTTDNYYPTSVFEALNAAFEPAVTYSTEEEGYIVDCNAIVPAHTIAIGGTAFKINALDMIQDWYTDDEGNEVCTIGYSDGGDDYSSDLFILGDTFLKNVVAVFDVGATEMKFAPHVHYKSNDDYYST